MTEEATSIDIPEDTTSAAGAGIVDQPIVEEAPEALAPKSTREMMEAELDKVQAEDKADEKDAKADDKPVKGEKELAKAEVKADKRDGVKPDAVPGEKAAKPSEGKAPEPPARFLPKAKEVWANTPNPVKAEVQRMEREFAVEREKHADNTKYREELRDFDEMAKAQGTTVRKALEDYVGMEQRFATQPDQELPRLLKMVGMDPVAAIQTILKSVGATPEQFAQYAAQNPQPRQQPQPQRQQPAPQESQALQRIDQLERRLQEQAIESGVVAPFVAQNPRFDELQEDIAFFLNSGKIPDTMSASERLEVAYDMAERLNPAPYREAPQPEAYLQPALVDPAAGRKSIRGAPTGGKAPALRTPSIREALAANWPV